MNNGRQVGGRKFIREQSLHQRQISDYIIDSSTTRDLSEKVVVLNSKP